MWWSDWETNVFQNAHDLSLLGDTYQWNRKDRKFRDISRNPNIIHLTVKLVVTETDLGF